MIPKTLSLTISLMVFLCLLIMAPSIAFSTGKTIEKDTDKDGVVDMIQIYGPHGHIREVLMDSDKNGVMDHFRHYQDEALVRIERDQDENGIIEVIDYFDTGKRIRQERKNTQGLVIQMALFDENDLPTVLKKDIGQNGFFEHVYTFKDGHVNRMTLDNDENGAVNVTVRYANDRPAFKAVDDNEDGKNEAEITYDDSGLPLFSRHDCDLDTVMDTFRTYSNGIISKQENDRDQDGVMDRIITFKNGIPSAEDKDSNLDHTMDCFLTYDDKGSIDEIREDSRYSGFIDRIRSFCSGVPVKTVYDTDGDRFIDTTYLFKSGKLSLQTKDENKDGAPDTRIFFDDNEEKKRLESDSDFNGNIDLVMTFDKEVKISSQKDSDGDGYFETIQWYNRPDWSLVTETDRNTNRVFESRFFFKDGALRKREYDENEDKTPDVIEYLKANGKLEKSEERSPDSGHIALVWLYDEKERPWCARQDIDGDGHFETCFYYANNRLTKVEEDTNKDGKPDLWETYDEAEVLISTRRDLDYDGVADLLKDKTGSYPLLASGGPFGGPDFKNLDKWVLGLTSNRRFPYPFVKLFKSLAPGRARGKNKYKDHIL